MTILLWWTLGSIAVSLFVGAFLQHGRREPETLDLDLLDPTRWSELPASQPPSTSRPAPGANIVR